MLDDAAGWLELDTPAVREAAERARLAIEAVHRHPVNRRSWPRTAAASLLRSARISAVLDGADPRAEPDSPMDPILAGSLRVAAALPELEAPWRRAPLQVLARLHTLAAADRVPAEQLGRPRAADLEAMPAAAAVPGRLAELAALVLQWDAIPLQPAVAVALVHGELLSIRPFGTGDGIVARAAGRLTMVTTGLDPRGLTVPEAGHLRARAEYVRAAGAYARGAATDRSAWVLHVCHALGRGAEEGQSSADAVGAG